MYGGTITSVLINVPGEAASVVTCIDGYQMARQGRAGSALGIAAIGSFVGGTLRHGGAGRGRHAARHARAEVRAGRVLRPDGGGPLPRRSGSPARTSLAALLMTVLGLLLAMIGLDPVRGAPRFTFGIAELFDGIGFVPVVMGLFGVAELLLAAETARRRA